MSTRYSSLKDRINFNGLYTHAADRKYSRSDDLFWCQNWTFRPFEYCGKVYMGDTYWSGGGGMIIEVTNDNIDEFELLFDFKDVRFTDDKYIEAFGEEGVTWWRVAIDSGGNSHKKTYVRKDAIRNLDIVIRQKEQEICELNRRIEYIQNEISVLKHAR